MKAFVPANASHTTSGEAAMLANVLTFVTMQLVEKPGLVVCLSIIHHLLNLSRETNPRVVPSTATLNTEHEKVMNTLKQTDLGENEDGVQYLAQHRMSFNMSNIFKLKPVETMVGVTWATSSLLKMQTTCS